MTGISGPTAAPLQQRDLARIARELDVRVDFGRLTPNWSAYASAAVVDDAHRYVRDLSTSDGAWAGRPVEWLDEVRFIAPVTHDPALNATWRTGIGQLGATGGTYALAHHVDRRVDVTAPLANGLRRGLTRLARDEHPATWAFQSQVDFYSAVETALHEAIHLATWGNGSNRMLEEALAEELGQQLTPAFAKAEFDISFSRDVIDAAREVGAYPRHRANLQQLLELAGRGGAADAEEAVRLLALDVVPAQRQQQIARWIAAEHGVAQPTRATLDRLAHEVDRTMYRGLGHPARLRDRIARYGTAELSPTESMQQAIEQLEQRRTLQVASRPQEPAAVAAVADAERATSRLPMLLAAGIGALLLGGIGIALANRD